MARTRGGEQFQDHYAASVRHLIAIAGPIGAGKSTVAELLARRAQSSALSVSLADLDELAFAQRADVDLDEFWRRAGHAHSALVRGWFDAGVDMVIAHGPFFESGSYRSLFAATPDGGRFHHVLLLAPFDVALDRVRSDPERGATALSAQPEFLRSTHEVFADVIQSLPQVDIEVDTSGLTADEVADHVFALLNLR